MKNLTMIVTVDDIRQRLNVTQMQVEMAIYSGALPPPSKKQVWDALHIEPFIENWQERIKRRNEKEN